MLEHDGGMFFGGGLMWLFWIALIVIIVFVVRMLSVTDKGLNSSTNDSPLEILKKRYARGEINEEEYKSCRKELEK